MIRAMHAIPMGIALMLPTLTLGQPTEAPPANVEVATADFAQIAPRRWAPGSVVSRDDARLATNAGGRLEQVADVGTLVEAGQRVAKLEDQAIRLRLEDARSELARIKAQRNLAQRQVERYEKLAADMSIAANQLDEARAQEQQLSAQERQAEVRIRSVRHELDQTEVRAPFAGIVSERLAQRGEFVNAGASIVRLVDTRHLEARVQAPLELAEMLKVGMQVPVRHGQHTATASVRVVIPVGTDSSRQFELRLSLPESMALVGTAIEAALPERKPERLLAVPRDAIVVRSEGNYVVRINDDNLSERVTVREIAHDGALSAVDGPLNPGDRVVIRGAERLGEGQKVQVGSGQGLATLTTPAGRNPG